MRLKALIISLAVAVSTMAQDQSAAKSFTDSIFEVMDSVGFVPVTRPLPQVLFLPPVYTGYDRTLAGNRIGRMPSHVDGMPDWLTASMAARKFANELMQHHAVNNLAFVPYNINTMPDPPKKFVASADPNSALVIFREAGPLPGAVQAEKPNDIAPVEIAKQHWLNKFGVLLQFSQGYVSPNWYQGGNNSLNLISDFTYQTNLNTKFHPDLMFENFFQWRTALASTPDDPHRAYSLTENRFQINSKFGVKAFRGRKWYYSFNGMLKTPVFNGYRNGTLTRTAAFMAPGEVNVGLGMSYNVTTKNGKFRYSLSISPLSYNLKTYLDRQVRENSNAPKYKSAYGSNLEMNWEWKMAYNISWKSRIFAFTNYHYAQADWQNQFSFAINRWLSANLNVDMRYDSSTKIKPDWGRWHQVQLREILSLGFSYNISH